MKQLYYITALLLLFNVSLLGQVKKLTRELQQTLNAQTKEMVERFERNCELIADKEKPFHKKTGFDGYIKVALQDFDREDRTIEITNGQKKDTKTVYEYLNRLANLPYGKIKITFADAYMTDEFKPSAEKGAGWYEGVASIVQKFEAYTKDGQPVFNDTVDRIVKIYAKEITVLDRRGKYNKKFQVRLGDIKARNI